MMRSIEEIRRFLGQTPVPTISESPHRDQLKRQLLESAQPGKEKRRVFRFGQMPPMLKLAAALLVAAILVGTGWAAERIYRKFTDFSVILERSPIRTRELPDGTKMTVGGAIGGTISSEDPIAIAQARRHHEEMKQLIAEKKYEFVKTFESAGEKQYVYRFALADGSHVAMNFSLPLENVTSWDDYQQKDEERQKQRQEQINKALAAGYFRLIDADVHRIHICRDVDSNQKYRVQRIVRRGGKEIALYRPFDMKVEDQAATMPQTSWQDHLQAIRNGKRELLSLETSRTYTYEVVLEDGSKTIFQYGGGEPLKKLERK